MKPPALCPGATIAIVSPSAGIAGQVPRRFQRGLAALEALGYRPRVMPHALGSRGHRAASYAEQAADLNAAFRDPEVAMILATIGGYTSNGLLPLLDWEAIRANPKILMGFSDTTALLAGIHAQTGLVTFHGPSLLFDFAEFPAPHAYTRNAFLAVARGECPTFHCSPEWTNDRQRWEGDDERPDLMVANEGWHVFRPGRCRGRLVGGNLTILLALAGTPYFPDLAGRILFIEEDDEPGLDAWECHLNHLRLLGAFEQIAGLFIGRHIPSERLGTPDDFTQLLVDHFSDAPFPIAWNMDFGHTQPMLTLPLGIEVEVATTAQTITLLEPAVAQS